MEKKILIIDDAPDIRFLLKRALVHHSYSVREAEDLQQGIALYYETSPDIVILDVNLPDGNGMNQAHKFKNDDNMVILISADNDHLTERYKDFFASAFLKKPFTPEELLAVINKKVTAQLIQ